MRDSVACRGFGYSAEGIAQPGGDMSGSCTGRNENAAASNA